MSAVMTESAPRHPDGKRRKNGCMKTQRALFWFGSAALGALGGLALGQVAIGEGLYGKLTGASAATSFAEYSSNPLAATVDSIPAPRSEEHTSELQSLMRISYAVFCLKTKIH